MLWLSKSFDYCFSCEKKEPSPRKNKAGKKKREKEGHYLYNRF
jgi:hypothetical protein